MGRVNVERAVAVDWSGDRSAAGQRRKIWAGVWTAGAGKVDGGRVTLEGGRTRAEVGEWLIGMARETPRMVVGLDFCFSFPAWFVRGELGCTDGPEFWELVAGGRASSGWRRGVRMGGSGGSIQSRRSSAAMGCTGCCAPPTSTASWPRGFPRPSARRG